MSYTCTGGQYFDGPTSFSMDVDGETERLYVVEEKPWIFGGLDGAEEVTNGAFTTEADDLVQYWVDPM